MAKLYADLGSIGSQAVFDQTVLDQAALDQAVMDQAELDQAVLDQAVLAQAVMDQAVPAIVQTSFSMASSLLVMYSSCIRLTCTTRGSNDLLLTFLVASFLAF